MDYQLIREKAVEFMLERGWKQKTAKRKFFDQSLFDHSPVVLDAMIALLPVLRDTFEPPLSEQEEQILVTGVVAHDTGKELNDFQEYILGRRNFVSDVNWEHAMQVVPELAALFGFTGIEEMLSSVLLHMSHERTPAKVMDRVLFGKHTNERWKTLADIVDQVDNLASSPGLFDALKYLEKRSMFSNHVHAAYHAVRLRGVSTTLLHRAAIDAFLDKGWRPLLHYSNGTIYVASVTAKVDEPTVDEIESRLAEGIKAALPKNMAALVVGSPLETMIPKVDLYDYHDLRACLRFAARKVNRANFMKKGETDRREVVGKYLTLSKKLASKNSVRSAITASDEDWKRGYRPTIDKEILARHTERIGAARPEMCIFKFFKAAIAPELLGDKVTPKAQKTYATFAKGGKRAKVTPQDVARAEYDKVFGDGAYAALQATSTLMPARDMALTVDRFWSLDGKHFNLGVAKIENLLDDAKREEILIDILVGIAEKVYAAVPEENRPTRATPEQIAKCFIADLIHPAPYLDLTELVTQQMQAYAQTKANARRSRGAHLCPICNVAFEGGTEAKADFVENPEAHTNRAMSHSGGGKIVICNACKFERFLQQLLLGSKVSEVLVLFPRMNIGHGSGEALRMKAIQIWDAALSRMSEANPDPDQHISISMTFNLARKLADVDIFRLSPKDIVNLMTYESGEETKKKQRKELEKRLKQLYDVDELTVDVLNDNWGTDYTTKDEAIQALISNKVTDDDARKIRAEAFHLTRQMRIVCETPHMILVPLTNPIRMEDESDTNAAIRELYVTLFLGLALDCSVAVMRAGEVITFEGGEGVARVPPVSALRELIGAEWVRTDAAKRWLDAIGAAALLANATAFPERSNLYAILKSPTPGHILRRIEQKSGAGQAYIGHIHLLEILKEVLQ